MPPVGQNQLDFPSPHDPLAEDPSLSVAIQPEPPYGVRAETAGLNRADSLLRPATRHLNTARRPNQTDSLLHLATCPWTPLATAKPHGEP